MSKGGIIIRLIDVAMIILFGFIAISDIKVKAQIKLPSRQEENEVQEEPELIFVKVGLNNEFVVEKNKAVLARSESLADLENTLVELFEQDPKPHGQRVVIVEPHPESMIQRTVDVLDLCERHNIPKSISY